LRAWLELLVATTILATAQFLEVVDAAPFGLEGHDLAVLSLGG
jgi:hypothetical protein